MSPRSGGLHLITRRVIGAPPERLFAAWTQPEQLVQWWGPGEVTCPQAEVDLREGGRYRLANRGPDGQVIWITGVFERVQAPSRLVYSWAHEPVTEDSEVSRVTVRFEDHARGCEVIVVHERLDSAESRDRHLAGWGGCLAGLAGLLGSVPSS